MVQVTKNIAGILISIIAGIIVLYSIFYFIPKNLLPGYFYEGLVIGVLLIVTYLVTKFLGSIIYHAFAKQGESIAKHMKSTFEIIFFLIIIFIIFLSVGENLTASLVGAGIFGIILGVAAQSSLSNFFAGLYILLSRPFEVGQRINVITSQYSGFGPTYEHEFIPPKYIGVVDEVGFLYTRIINDENYIMIIPNNVFLNALVINYQKNEVVKIKLFVEIPLKYDPVYVLEKLKYKIRSEGKISDEVEIKLISLKKEFYDAEIYVKEKHEKIDFVNDIILRYIREIVYSDT